MAMGKDVLSVVASQYGVEKLVDEVKTLPKCKYPTYIYTEMKKIFASSDYFSDLKSFLDLYPLEQLPQDDSGITKLVPKLIEEMGEEPRIIYTQPNIIKLERVIINLADFTENFVIKFNKLKCKEGFADLLLAAFAKYNAPKTFAVFKTIFENDHTACTAYEDWTICSPLPMEPEEVVKKLGALAYNTEVDFHHL